MSKIASPLTLDLTNTRAFKTWLYDLWRSTGGDTSTGADLITLRSDVDALEVDVDALEVDVSVLQSDVSVLQSDVSALQSDVSVLQSDVSVLQNDVSVLQNDVDALEVDVSVLQNDVDALEVDVSVLQSNQVLTKQTIVDLGSTYVFDKTINVIDADVTINSLMMAQIAPIANGYTRPIEEVIYEKITIQPIPKAGSIDFYIQPQSGHIKGLFAITYTVAL